MKKTLPDPIELAQSLIAGDRNALSRAITLTESRRKDHRLLAEQVMEACLPHSGKSIRIGITGVPGVGKSTFIEAFGNYLIDAHGKRPAVLAVDPSSQRSGGSILGDKTRMNLLSGRKEAFIRPSPSAGALGGVAEKSRETLLLCEAAGYDVILVETVGVGQSETEVHDMVDFFLLLMLPGAGDELQGIKRGIMEMADAILINKSEGDNAARATQAKRAYKSALHLFPPTASSWVPQVENISALQEEGIDKAWKIIEKYMNQIGESDFFAAKRKQQAIDWMYRSIDEYLRITFTNNEEVKTLLEDFKQQVIDGRIGPSKAARLILEKGGFS